MPTRLTRKKLYHIDFMSPCFVSSSSNNNKFTNKSYSVLIRTVGCFNSGYPILAFLPQLVMLLIWLEVL